MSQLSSSTRASRPALRGFDRAAVERARLALVPVRRVDAPRAPFAVLVFLMLGAGVVGLLMFNTQMQQDSFYATRLQHQADQLTAQRESLQMDLDKLRDPQHLAQQASQLHMVQAPVPAQINLSTGKVDGVPTVATSEDRVPINPQLKVPGQPFRPPTRVVHVTPKTAAAATAPTKKASTKKAPTKKSGRNGTTNGPASTANTAGAGTNRAGTAAQGAPR